MTVHFASAATPPTAHRPLLRHTAGAALLACSLFSLPAWALTLGPITVQSHLGEPLRAQIELPGLNADELASLQVQVGTPADFAAAQLPWQALAADVRFQVRRLDNGRTVLLLNTRQTVREPFLDLVVQAQSANGRILRGYTLLFDPPCLKPAAPAAPVSPQVQARPAAAPSSPAAAPLPPVGREPTTALAAPPARVTVQPGQTAGQIAQATRPAGVTLEQMLVALLQANPPAFVDGNMNRLRSGSVLNLPSAEQAQAVSPEAARQVVVAQSRDFDAYRQRLAAASPAAAPEASGRESRGQVQADVTDSRPEAPSADRLTLAQATADAELAAEAQRREQADQQARQAEVERNLEQLQQLQASAQAPASAAPPAAKPAPSAPAAAVDAGPAAPAAAPSAAHWLQAWLSHPLALPAAGGLAVLLLVLGLLRRRRAAVPSALPVAVEPPAAAPSTPAPLAPVVPPQAEAQPSTLMFSASQLQQDRHADAIAEADVFMAYGRYAQAEEILREALQDAPDHPELLDKLQQAQRARQDAEGMAATASAPVVPPPVVAVAPPPAPEPAPAPVNQPAESPTLAEPVAAEPAPPAPAPATAAATANAEPPALDFDLDLDFAAPAVTAPAPTPTAPSPEDTPPPAATEPTMPPPGADNGIDFDLDLDLDFRRQTAG